MTCLRAVRDARAVRALPCTLPHPDRLRLSRAANADMACTTRSSNPLTFLEQLVCCLAVQALDVCERLHAAVSGTRGAVMGQQISQMLF